MMGANPAMRFGLRSLLAGVPFVAILVAFPRVTGGLVYLAWVTGPCVGFASFMMVRNKARAGSVPPRRPGTFGWLVVCFSILCVVAALWIRQRWAVAWWHDDWPRPFPFPDEALTRLHDWWDALNPPPPGHLKIHAEHLAVLQVTNCLLLLSFAFAGTVAGWGLAHVDSVSALGRFRDFVGPGKSRG